MKTKNLFLLATVALMGTMQSCKNDTVTPEPVTVSTSATDLISLLASTPPTADATIDASWDGCNKLTSNTAEVPDTTLFPKEYKLFMGKTETFTIRSQYDANNIYFLVELNDLTQSIDNKAWYYNPITKLWKQPATVSDTTVTFQAGQDRFGMIFPVNDNAAWNKQTCLATCHYDVNKTYTNHYTTDATFTADAWLWSSVGAQANNQLSDGFIGTDFAAGSTTTKIGRQSSDSASTKYTFGTANSIKLLKTGGVAGVKTDSVTVPKYVLVSAGGPVITQADVTNGVAKLVTAVDANGILSYAGGTIDPTKNSDYAYKTGTKRIPAGLNGGPITGSAGDVKTYASYVTGKGWVIKVIRKIATSDKAKDVQFDITKTYMFGFATFDNANNQHLIKTNLKLSFATVAAK